MSNLGTPPSGKLEHNEACMRGPIDGPMVDGCPRCEQIRSQAREFWLPRRARITEVSVDKGTLSWELEFEEEVS